MYSPIHRLCIHHTSFMYPSQSIYIHASEIHTFSVQRSSFFVHSRTKHSYTIHACINVCIHPSHGCHPRIHPCILYTSTVHRSYILHPHNIHSSIFDFRFIHSQHRRQSAMHSFVHSFMGHSCIHPLPTTHTYFHRP